MTLVRIPSPSPYAATAGFSAAVRAGDLVVVAGMTALSADGELVGGDDPYTQTREALRKVSEALQAAGATLEDVVQTRVSVANRGDWEPVGRAHGEVFGEAPPAMAMLVIGLVDERMLVEIEAIARVGHQG